LPLLLTALALIMSQHQDTRWKVVQPYDAKLERMAYCESRKRWFLDSGNKFYGGLQFKLSTWKWVGGKGYPHKNSELEQKYRAVILIKRDGYGHWPRCRYA
jgi:resuscitation-promoting factor RpfA